MSDNKSNTAVVLKSDIWVCLQKGHFRTAHGDCRRCGFELPDETIEENLQKQINKLNEKVTKLQEELKHASFESTIND